MEYLSPACIPCGKLARLLTKWILKKGYKSHWKRQRSCNIGGFLEWILLWKYVTFCDFLYVAFQLILIKKLITLVRLVFHYALFLSHQLRLVLNIYEGVLVILHGEAESNWPEWWVTAVWLSHRPLFSWILGRRFEINWAFVKYLNITNNKSSYILVGFNFLFQSQKSVFHLHLADHCDLVCPGLSDDFFKHSRCEMLSTIFHIVKMKKWNKTKAIV